MMDVSIAGWILEFLLRQPIEDRTIVSLLSTIPLPNDDYRLTKTILLRRISSEIDNCSVSVKTLETLEMIEQCDYECKVAILDSMREAYCAVAVHCTVMCLRDNPSNVRNYFNAVVKIWRERIGDMEKCEGVGLVSDRLKDTRDEIEEAVWDVNVRDNVLKRDTLNNAVRALRVFVKDATEKIGPSILEVAAKVVTGKNVVDDQTEEREVCSFDVHRDMVSGSDGAVDSCVEVPRAATRAFNVVGTPEFRKVQEELRSSTLELQKVVNDPLPDALRFAATVSASLAKEVTMNPLENQNVGNVIDKGKGPYVPTTDEGVEAVDANEANIGMGGVPRPSLMVRNSTARTFEWDDDSIEVSDEEGSPSRPHLPTPKKRRVSPLVFEDTRKIIRRKPKKWSALEEQSLRDGVKEFGKGNWKLILDRYSEILEGRTVVDLKDKWRNMVK